MKILIIGLGFFYAAASFAASKCASDNLSAPVAHLHTDLDHYNTEMEKSSAQKAGFGALARPGLILDLGCGSGKSAFDLALLFPDSRIIGIDLDPHEIEYARAHYSLPNLEFRVGDALKPDFEENSVDAIFISSTWHHLTSYGGDDFRFRVILQSIVAHARLLKTDGLLIGRDFVAPARNERVWLDVPANDGASEGSPEELSTAAFFKLYAQDFRSRLHPDEGVPFKSLAGAREGWERFELTNYDRTEFLLRNAYRKTYHAEIRESYLVGNQKKIENAFMEAGLRPLFSTPIFNPWIVNNWWREKFGLLDRNGERMAWPATNFGIGGQKVGAGEGLYFKGRPRAKKSAPKFLRLRAMQDQITQQIFDVVERPNETVDVLPYFERGQRFYVLGRQGYPRPIVTMANRESLTGTRSHGYVVEPLAFINTSLTAFFGGVEHKLQKRANILPSQILPEGPGPAYVFYPSPGLVVERSTLISVPIQDQEITSSRPEENYSGFSTSGMIKPLEATQVLRSAQVGATLDARLELGVYHLLLDKQKPVGMWIGDDVQLADQSAEIKFYSFAELVRAPRERRFAEVDADKFGKFLKVERRAFDEFGAKQKRLASRTLEYVEPRKMSSLVISALPIYKHAGEVFVGLETRQLPTVQLFEGTSNIVNNPAWRLPRGIGDLDSAAEYVGEYLKKDFGVNLIAWQNLGGLYHPSPGVSSETVYPILVEVTPTEDDQLKWVKLRDLIDHRREIRDGHLSIAALRAAHALGIL